MKVILYGIGSIGSQIARSVLNKPWLQVVGAVDAAPDKIGRDLGEIIGLKRNTGIIIQEADEVISKVQADVVIHSTSSRLREVFSQIETCLKSELNVVSTCEELAFPYLKYPELSKQLDMTAKEHNVTVLGTGINPGYLMDTLPIILTAPCTEVHSIKVRRMMYSGNRRDSYQKKIGTGLTQDQFERMIQEKKITGHVGLEESISMIAAALNWKLDEIVVQLPVCITTKNKVSTTFTTIHSGQVCGLESVAFGIRNKIKVITLEFISHANIKQPYDSISVKGTPDIYQKIKGGVNGDIGTVGMLLNSIPKVVNAPDGLVTMKEMMLPSYQSL
jgi:4-hydroxy-tetrahydrodipicolinate reductase